MLKTSHFLDPLSNQEKENARIADVAPDKKKKARTQQLGSESEADRKARRRREEPRIAHGARWAGYPGPQMETVWPMRNMDKHDDLPVLMGLKHVETRSQLD